MSNQVFRYLFRVRYAECDAQNVVFNARYADYADMAATEFLRACGLDYRELLETGLDNQVVRLVLDWQAPAHFDDVIEARCQVARIGNTSYVLSTQFCNAATGRLLASAEAVYVMMDRESWQKTPVPAALRERLEQGGRGKVTNHAGT